MKENIGKEILEKPEDFVVIKSPEQLLQTYPDWFEKIDIDLLSFYIEKAPVKKDGVVDFSASHQRYVLTPSGIVRISSANTKTIWSINKEDIEVLKEMNVFAGKLRIKENNMPLEIYTTEVGGESVNMAYFPYNDPLSTNNVMSDLETNHLVESIDNKNIE